MIHLKGPGTRLGIRDHKRSVSLTRGNKKCPGSTVAVLALMSGLPLGVSIHVSCKGSLLIRWNSKLSMHDVIMSQWAEHQGLYDIHRVCVSVCLSRVFLCNG